MKQLTWLEKKILQGTAVIAASFSTLFMYLIIQAFYSRPKFEIILDFNAAGEGLLEMLVVFPLCIFVSYAGFIVAYYLD